MFSVGCKVVEFFLSGVVLLYWCVWLSVVMEEVFIARLRRRVNEHQAFTVVSRPSTNGAALARGFLLCNNTVRATNSIGNGTATGRTMDS